MKVNLFCPINTTGYGNHSINFGLELDRIVEVTLYPITEIDRNVVEQNPALVEMIKRGDRPNFNQPSIQIWHDNSMVFPGNPRIAYTVFELETISERSRCHLNACDEVWVPSDWAVKVLRDNRIEKPISVVPEGVSGLFEYNDSQNPVASRLQMISIGKFEVRKGHYLLLDSLPEVDYPIDLWALWHNPFLSNSRIDQELVRRGYYKVSKSIHNNVGYELYSSPEGNVRIFLVNSRFPNQKFIKELLKEVSLGIFPSFAEGWNLPLCEAMATGLPCITTNYSGHTQYVNRDNCVLIEPEKLCLAFDDMWFRNQGKWAEISKQQIVDSIKDVLANQDKLNKIRASLKDFGTKWSWINSAKTAISILES